MKKHLMIFTVLFASIAYGQVGINTENPQGIFNIDGGKDNPSTGSAHTSAQQLNDFTVLANGNTGIGTVAPTQKLDIRTGGTPATPVTGFRLVDGNQAAGRILTTDANGVGTWHLPNLAYSDIPYVGGLKIDFAEPIAPPYNTNCHRGGMILNADNTPYKITLPGPGIYQISLGLRLYTRTPAMNGEHDKVQYAFLSFLTQSNFSSWADVNRFKGSYESLGRSMNITPSGQYHFELNQIISIDNTTGNDVYLGILLSSNNLAIGDNICTDPLESLPATFSSNFVGVGNGAIVTPQRHGGSWVRIKDL